MIDIENKVLNTVFNAVQAAYSTASCYGEYVSVPAAFPCVTLYESDSRTYTQSNDEHLHEHQAIVTYESNVYCQHKESTSKRNRGHRGPHHAIHEIRPRHAIPNP